ncbi:MAG: carbohydrate-binding protein, partial [Fibrobacter sp.]|nr:carbohydrate-binding protein [Fibrobacter sp.]
VGYIQSGEWLEYTIDVKEAGDYTMYAAVASDGGSSFSVSVDDKVVAETIEVPKANKAEGSEEQDFDSYVKVGANVTLSVGKHVLRITATSDWFDIDYINFAAGKNAVDPLPIGSDPTFIGAKHKTIVFSNFDTPQAAQVFDMNGKLMKAITLNSIAQDEVRSTLKNVGLDNGIYFVRIPGFRTVKVNLTNVNR